ncbi:MAG: hypothetical protein A3A44_02195 [Candidatus Sungbacteria bacterium RIFCSPLOWO2_01_FULL_60_25]|uniref:inosine/xanthosine triphosphatase n=1 Tax=Candidatus Sungbacteria bacterium RIFCSPLOWO2_01_FULL_60_25 TaxID=1802281 RepID=A0A1G2LDJ4_9BACT|nr:MAG: hypothetical protein A3A44_02195 [Candidatus Sungbacteria bacterium RIFCSPLOWO2_01_FULL_60_25]
MKEAIASYPEFDGAEVDGVEVKTEEFGHPISLPTIVDGAMDRARQAFRECEYSVGIEGGLIEVPKTKSGYMEVAVAVMYDGVRFHLGLSPAYEWPKSVTERIVKKGLDGSQALREAGFTDHEKIGTAEGGISILTKGRMNRKEYNKLAVMMALIHLENKEHY